MLDFIPPPWERPPSWKEGDTEPSLWSWGAAPAGRESAVPGLGEGSVWQLGATVAIWTDIREERLSLVIAGRGVEISAPDGRRVLFECEFDQRTLARVTIDEVVYDLANGNTLLVSTAGSRCHVKQLRRDLSQLKFDPAQQPVRPGRPRDYRFFPRGDARDNRPEETLNRPSQCWGKQRCQGKRRDKPAWSCG